MQSDRAAVRRYSTALTALAMAAMLAVRAAPAAEDRSVLLNSARQAYNDRNYAFAADKFREYLRNYMPRNEAAPRNMDWR